MADNEFDNDENNQQTTGGKRKGGKSGSGGGVRLPPNKMKQVTTEWEFLDATKVIARLAEFFSELPARVSVNAQVTWGNVQNQGHTIVTQLLKAAEVARLMFQLTRENVEKLRREFGINLSGPAG